MKIVVLIARFLAGFLFTAVGLNGLIHFANVPLPPGDATTYIALIQRHFALDLLVYGTQVFAGVLLLTGRFIPLAVALLASIIVNILAFHIAMAPEQIAPALLAAILWGIVAYDARANFATIFEPNVRHYSEDAAKPVPSIADA